MNLKKKIREFFTLDRNADGFTLIELIVVIAIVAILGGVAVPAYSGYIEKADRAADAQLLADVNKAFAAACMVVGVDNYNAPGAAANVKEMTVTITGEQAGAFATAYNNFFDNEGTFKQEDIQLYYNKNIGGFAENGSITVKYGDQEIVFTSEQIEAIMNSNFGPLGAKALVGKVDLATDILNALAGENNEKVLDMIYSEANEQSIIKLLGSEEAWKTLVEEKAKKIAEQEGISFEEAMVKADVEVLTNAAVLTAATNSNLYDRDEFISQLATGQAKKTIISNLNGNDEQMAAATAQAAFVYGMYTSYAAKNQIKVDDNISMQTILAEMDKKEFQNYMANESAADVNAYYAAMDMINTSTQNKDAVADVLANGFENEKLLGMMQDALN